MDDSRPQALIIGMLLHFLYYWPECYVWEVDLMVPGVRVDIRRIYLPRCFQDGSQPCFSSNVGDLAEEEVGTRMRSLFPRLSLLSDVSHLFSLSTLISLLQPCCL